VKHHLYTGTRDDPHAQPRQARGLPLLLHSMAVFREVFELIFTSRELSTVIEIGVESGKVSGMYVELGASAVYCVDPKPTDELRANLAENPALHLVQGWSPEVLGELPKADLYVLDGDHNYATVHDELTWVMANASDAIVVLHDVLWPCSRRDLYYDPSAVPPGRKHEASTDGPTVWHDELSPAGFVGLGAFTTACHAGGERNGVLTAVEDALAQARDEDTWHFELIPAVFGMGVVVRQADPSVQRLLESLRRYSESHLLATMENNRIALYTRLLHMQHEAVAHAEDADQLAEAVSRQRHEIERLEADSERLAARHADDLQHLRQDNDRLRELLNQRMRPRIAAALRRVGKAAQPHVRRALRR